MVSWNGRGICVTNSVGRQDAADMVVDLSKIFDVLCFQEVHGLQVEILRQFQLWLPNWQFCVSGFLGTDECPNPGTGGVVIAVRPGVAREAVIHEVLVPGRCQVASITGSDGKMFSIVNLHNFDFSVDEVDKVGMAMRALAARDRERPDDSFSMLIGDMNFDGENGLRFKAGRPIPAQTLARPMPSGTRKAQWLPYLEEWLEIAQPFPTHFSARSQTGARLDRCWVAAPASQVLETAISSNVLNSPEDFEAREVSDHAPLAVIFSPRRTGIFQSRPIPRKVCRDPAFAVHINSLAAGIDLLSQPIQDQLYLYNKIIQQAARRVRDGLFSSQPASTSSVRLVLSSMSRAIWRNDVRLGTKLIKSSDVAQQFLRVSVFKVSCVDFGCPVC